MDDTSAGGSTVIEATKAGALQVPGARLRYDVTGTGPVLLLVHGGIADSAMLKQFAALLASRHTVVTYDRRGYGDSPLDDPDQEQSVELHADDAHRLLAEITSEPADVVGFSSGAFIGLELVARHPEQVCTLVAFEPPITELLPDREWHRADGQEIYETYRRDGSGAAMARFTGVVEGESGPDSAGPSPDPTPEMLEFTARMGRNVEHFFAREFLPFGDWLPDVEALREAPGRTVVGGGDASGTQPARRAADALAERLGAGVAEFPGDHAGAVTQPEAFAATLERALGGLSPSFQDRSK
jgi:pimeloyl-ACP methyl ester carboxylesterase